MENKIDWYDEKQAGRIETALFVSYEPNHHGSGLLKVYPVEFHYASRTIRSFSGDCYSDSKQLGSLTCYSYLFHDAANPHRCYNMSVEYREKFSVNLSQAKAMVRTLTKVESSIQKQAEELGSADTHGEFVRRFAKALGIKWVASEYPNSVRGSWDETNEHMRVMSATDAKDHVNWIVSDHYKNHGLQKVG